NPIPAVRAFSNEELIAKAKRARNGAAFARLFDGDWEGHGSQSEADFALASHLAFWTGKNRAWIDELFRMSSLMRLKWDEKHYGDGRTYGEETISRACDRTVEVYTPPRPSTNGTGSAPRANQPTKSKPEPPAASGQRETAIVEPFSAIAPAQLEWLWPGRIPLGKL